jgi:hypothetical protein
MSLQAREDAAFDLYETSDHGDTDSLYAAWREAAGAAMATHNRCPQ